MALQEKWQPPASLIPLVGLSRRSVLLKTRQVLAISFPSLPAGLWVEMLAQMSICKVFQTLHLKPVSTGSLLVLPGALWIRASRKVSAHLLLGCQSPRTGSCGDKHPVELFQGCFSTSVSTGQMNRFLSFHPHRKPLYDHQRVYT